jgi:SAM-dependent methyltransferase
MSHAHPHGHAHADAHTDEVTQFVAGALTGRSRVLEVGCGRGQVARALAAHGFAVTALDMQLIDVVEAPAVRFVERDFLAFDDAPFDALVFTSSLHHIAPLAKAVERAHALLRPNGLLVADEFDVEAPDALTLRWYYDVQELLVAADRYPADRLDEPNDDVGARWLRAHHHEPRLHTGAEMRAALAERFRILSHARGEYLHRYIAGGVSGHERGSAIASQVLVMERRLIAHGVVAPVGLRIIAERADA